MTHSLVEGTKDPDVPGSLSGNALLLLLGEGNFSFSASLALSIKFHSFQCELIATDFVPEVENYLTPVADKVSSNGDSMGNWNGKGLNTLKENVHTLKSLGRTVLFDVDATKLHANNRIIDMCRAHALSKIIVIFNFPHVKCKKMKIGLNRELLKGFFESCDKFVHIIRENIANEKPMREIEVIPIVSLCSGQSGIPDVENVTREWADSWQINDMAAHGNFVCVSVGNFENWDLYTLSKSCTAENVDLTAKNNMYHSCYFRLQDDVSFITTNALTLTYQHREHLNPNASGRLESLLISEASKSSNEGSVLQSFTQVFSPILQEKFVYANQGGITESEGKKEAKRNYNHVVVIKFEENMTPHKIQEYLNKSRNGSTYEVKIESSQIILKKTCDEFMAMTIKAGTISDDRKSASLFADILLELRYDEDYRHLLSLDTAFTQERERSLYPRTHEFHISFWINSKFSEDAFIETLLDLYGLMLKGVNFIEEYVNENGRKSVCWRIQVESLHLALSRHCAHLIYLNLRQELVDRLEVEVR